MILERPDVSSGALAIAGVRVPRVVDGGEAIPERGWERASGQARVAAGRTHDAVRGHAGAFDLRISPA